MLGAQLSAGEYLQRAAQELLRVDPKELEALADAIHDSFVKRRCVFICGNGGSAANASHFCEDLGKSTIPRSRYDDDGQPRLRVISLTDNTPYILAWANDEGYDRIFIEQLKNLASPGDLLIAISGSGNSPNILRAVEWANRHGLVTFGVTGFNGGQLKRMAQRCLHVRLADMGLVESIHLVAFHWVLGELYRRIASESHPRDAS
jgi:D-sedoheptulose 7-phosphate isomerase